MRARYRQLSHSADLIVKIYGRSRAELFKNAAHALTGMIADERHLEQARPRTFKLSSTDQESLLVDWLNELIFLFENKKELVRDIREIDLEQDLLRVKCGMARLIGGEGSVKNVIKAATYNDLSIKRSDGIYECSVVLDV